LRSPVATVKPRRDSRSRGVTRSATVSRLPRRITMSRQPLVPNGQFVRAGTLEEIKAKGCVVVSGADRPVAVFYHNGKVYAVDNRCPHLGFPLHRGTLHDGILTCHWHHARFDLTSGCTFDLWADDVPPCALE